MRPFSITPTLQSSMAKIRRPPQRYSRLHQAPPHVVPLAPGVAFSAAAALQRPVANKIQRVEHVYQSASNGPHHPNIRRMTQLSSECKTLIKRLKDCDLDVVERNPTSMLQYYPIRNPDKEETIYDEVYCILHETLLLKSYRFRIFLFLDTFLSSTKVPAYVIAAYMKRLSRMTLNAKPRSLVSILGIVENLIVSHPVLQLLRNRVDDKAREMEIVSKTCTIKLWLEDDPFDFEEVKDLSRTNAMDSCIWELMPLRFHRHPKVRRAASFLR